MQGLTGTKPVLSDVQDYNSLQNFKQMYLVKKESHLSDNMVKIIERAVTNEALLVLKQTLLSAHEIEVSRNAPGERGVGR